jgi:hypothetical protein
VKSTLGVLAVCALWAVAGCGGVAELDSGELQTVTAAESAVAAATNSGSLKPGDEQKFEDLIVLCREKPLSEVDGQSMRQVLEGLAPRLSGVDPELSSKLKRIAKNGCE